MKPTERGSVLISLHFRPQPITVYNGNPSVRKAQKHSKNAYTAHSWCNYKKKERNSAVSLSYTNKVSTPAAVGMPLVESG